MAEDKQNMPDQKVDKVKAAEERAKKVAAENFKAVGDKVRAEAAAQREATGEIPVGDLIAASKKIAQNQAEADQKKELERIQAMIEASKDVKTEPKK